MSRSVANGSDESRQTDFYADDSVRNPATVTISQPAGGGMPPTTMVIPAGGTVSLDMTPWIDVLENKPANTVLNYGVEIQSTAPITAYYHVVSGSCLCNPEDFVLKGNNALGTDFWIPGQDILDNTIGYLPTPSNAFDIVASQDATTVTITPSNDIVGHSGGTTFSVLLNKGQTYSATATSVLAAAHLRGSRVTSDKPIAITEKDDLLHYVSLGLAGNDLAGDQIVPVNVLGTEYIPMYGNLTTPGDMLFITATQNGTNVSLNGTLLTTLIAGQTYSMNCPNPSGYLQTSFPVYVYQLSGIGSEVGSALLPQITCTGSSSVSFQQSSSLAFKLNLLVKSAGTGSFLVNGVPGVITSSMFVPVTSTGGVWYSAQVTLPLSAYPTGSILTVSNSSLFQLGYLSSGPPATGSDFGYFSNYGGVDPEPTSTPSICVGDSLKLFSDTITSATYLWTGPDGFTSTLQNPLIISSVSADSGVYQVVVHTPGCIDSSSVTVAVRPSLTVNIGDDTTVCTGTPLSLFSTGSYLAPSYLWSTGSITSTIFPSTTGVYWLVVRDGSCVGSDTANITFTLSPPVNLGNDTSFCIGNSLTLSPLVATGSSLIWSTGTTSHSISVTTTGTYWVRVSIGSCVSSDTINVTLSPEPPVHLGLDTTICSGHPITLRSSDTYISPSYLWSNGATVAALTPAISGMYWLKVTVAGCTGADTVSVTFAPSPNVKSWK